MKTLEEAAEQLLGEALELAPRLRSAFIERACNGQPLLRGMVQSLLDEHERLPVSLSDPPLDATQKHAPTVHVERGCGTIAEQISPSHLADTSQIQFRPGQVLLERFRIVRLLGRGGMGEVFEAQDLQLGRIALKTIRADIAASPDMFARFRREVQLARRVSGAQVCRIHELFLLAAENGCPATAFLTMEFLEGTTLSRKIAESGPLGRDEALSIALDICKGLRLIHEQGIIHRDLKAANIMLCSRAGKTRAVVMDFGLAWLDSAALITPDAVTLSEIPSQTAYGCLAGTPSYMAPEQFEGKPVSPATDIYALGIVLYEMVTGRQPYAAETPVAAVIRHARRPDPISSVQRGIPRHWDRVIAQCLQYEPEQRFQNVAEVAGALAASTLRPENIRKDHPHLIWVLAIVLLAVIGFSSFSLWKTTQYYRPDAEANRWYHSGLSALREGSYLKATNELGNAVARDPHFVMAHARLAEAWANLDFDGAAQQQMLLASAGENRVPPVDRMYLDAIRDTLTRNFTGAVELYKTIVDRLPASEKGVGHLDLGMAYERAGDPPHALQNYRQSSSLDPDNPAPWLRAGMLQTRLNHSPEANQDFDRAQALYTAEMNPEGQAELDYERGYLASLKGNVANSVSYLQRSIVEAKAISSPQLEIRAFTQLSSTECASGQFDQAVADANTAIQLARSHELDTWAAMALAWLANAHLNQGSAHFAEADSELAEARELASESQQGRALALANLVLASLRDTEHRWPEVVAPATEALAYYRQNGFFANAANAKLLLLRATPVGDDLNRRLQDAQDFSNLAQNSGSPYLRLEAEHALGNAYELLERYPDALQHFGNALASAGSATGRAYEVIAMSGILVKLGRIAEAQARLGSLQFDPTYLLDVEGVRIEALLTQAQYGQAYSLSKRVLHDNPDMPQDQRREFRNALAVAAAHLGKNDEALSSFQDVPAGSGQNEADHPNSALQRLEIELLVGESGLVLSSVDDLLRGLESQSLLDSAMRANLIAAAASGAAGLKPEQASFTQKAIDNVTKLKHTWGQSPTLSYLGRPDLHALILELPSGSQSEFLK